ncbi:hypothetical protein LLE49_05770 [Alicyclobacillus tolerans]|uniref:hypothetical protein n=1 Tax=Alicyclobacillus tolerans TaxID=90970 RepID=UPI001F41B41A|nr:hypothetical protein [Alicyclobacillus tolerans]MCF8564249.1 hypothetical protein [Alicyclobacillus tolerans]
MEQLYVVWFSRGESEWTMSQPMKMRLIQKQAELLRINGFNTKILSVAESNDAWARKTFHPKPVSKS